MKKWMAYLCVAVVALFAATFLTAAAPQREASSPAGDGVLVCFDPGDGAEIIGSATLELHRGQVLGRAPQVEANSHQELDGWYVSGDPSMRLVNTEKLTVYESITLCAAYK